MLIILFDAFEFYIFVTFIHHITNFPQMHSTGLKTVTDGGSVVQCVQKLIYMLTNNDYL